MACVLQHAGCIPLHARLMLASSLSVSCLQEVRRFLPVSGQKMNWNAAEHRMRKTLQQSSAAAGGAASS